MFEEYANIRRRLQCYGSTVEYQPTPIPIARAKFIQ